MVGMGVELKSGPSSVIRRLVVLIFCYVDSHTAKQCRSGLLVVSVVTIFTVTKRLPTLDKGKMEGIEGAVTTNVWEVDGSRVGGLGYINT